MGLRRSCTALGRHYTARLTVLMSSRPYYKGTVVPRKFCMDEFHTSL